MVGKTLGPYKILEQLGAGGMGEVYLGEDTRLGRKVAIKVLPEEYAGDPERLARFEQEARAAAALNHPHIAVVHDLGSAAQYGFSPSGGLVYVPGASGGAVDRLLVWVDREGETVPASDRLRGYDSPAISPDDRRVAVQILESGGSRVWILDLANDTLTPLTVDGDSRDPVWSPNGEWVAFAWNTEGDLDLYRRRGDFSGEPELLLEAPGDQFPRSWSEGDLLTYESSSDIGYFAVEGERAATELIASPANENNPHVSPNDRWIAYESNESGAFQIYVQPFPEGGRRYTISNNGGREAVWSADGTELYYRAFPNASQVMVVDVDTDTDFGHAPPSELFSRPFFDVPGPNYDVARDGRFLGILPAATAEAQEPA